MIDQPNAANPPGSGSRGEKKEFATLQAEIDETMDRVISNLLLHIRKEDKLLYPLALKTIDDPAVWEEMRVHCNCSSA